MAFHKFEVRTSTNPSHLIGFLHVEDPNAEFFDIEAKDENLGVPVIHRLQRASVYIRDTMVVPPLFREYYAFQAGKIPYIELYRCPNFQRLDQGRVIN